LSVLLLDRGRYRLPLSTTRRVTVFDELLNRPCVQFAARLAGSHSAKCDCANIREVRHDKGDCRPYGENLEN
jgi:hypothetical protein